MALYTLVMYLKSNSIGFYYLFDKNRTLLLKKINFCLSDKQLSLIFVFNKLALVQDPKVYFINFLNFELVKIFLYFLN